MILFFYILSTLLVLNVLLLVFSVNKTNKQSSPSGLDKVYFKPKGREYVLEETRRYSIS